jgi:hypothetical protein
MSFIWSPLPEKDSKMRTGWGTWITVSVIPHSHVPFLNGDRKREIKMDTLQRTEHYTDKGHYAVMTRTSVIKHAQLVRIADHLRRNAEDLASSTDVPTFENCRIAGAMVTWAFSIAPLRIEAGLDN